MVSSQKTKIGSIVATLKDSFLKSQNTDQQATI